MIRFLLAAAVALTLSLASPAHAVPCFDSVEAARAQGVTGRLAYQLIHGPKEWFRGHKGQHVKCDGAPNTVSVLDRPRSRSKRELDTPKAAGADRISSDTKQDTARPDGGMRRTAASGDGRKVDPAGRDTPAAGTNTPPVTTGMNVSAPPPAVTDWSIRVKTEPAQWPREVSFDPPPLTMTAEQVKAAPVEEEPSMTLALMHASPLFLSALALFVLVYFWDWLWLIWLGWR